MVVLQQTHGRIRCNVRVHPLINNVVNTHKTLTGRATELPHPRGSSAGVGVRVERRFYVRKYRKLRGQALFPDDGIDVLPVSTRAAQAAQKTIRLPELKADIVDGLAQKFVADIFRPEEKDLPLTFGQAASFAAGQDTQICLNLVTLVFNLTPVERHPIVNHSQIPRVMKKTTLCIDLGIYASPETHGRFQLRWTRKQLRILCCSVCRQQRKEEGYD